MSMKSLDRSVLALAALCSAKKSSLDKSIDELTRLVKHVASDETKHHSRRGLVHAYEATGRAPGRVDPHLTTGRPIHGPEEPPSQPPSLGEEQPPQPPQEDEDGEDEEEDEIPLPYNVAAGDETDRTPAL